jgi:Rps23 Pro-64 3,4-dihydroxylase Tpa1-like proline 4-hydroxylase
MTLDDGALMGRVEALFEQSIETLSALLADPGLGAAEKSAIAMKLLEVAMGSGEADGKPTAAGLPSALPDFALAAAAPPETLAPRFVAIDDFLPAAENRDLIALAARHRSDFVASTTTTGAANYRQSLVLYPAHFESQQAAMRARILAILPRILAGLDFGYFWLADIEMQMTAHLDGGFYKRHDDAGSPDTATRILSYVYYFGPEPAGFTGGELRLYRTGPGEGALESAPESAPESATVAPANNRIVFFDSRLMHEVLPVACPSGAFAEARFTLNGWLRRAGAPTPE